MTNLRYLSGVKLTASRYRAILESPDFIGEFWKDDARCTKMMREEPERYKRMDWFPQAKPVRVPPKIAEICGACPVRLECLAHAIHGPEPVGGIWGGHTYKGVKKIRRRWRRIEE